MSLTLAQIDWSEADQEMWAALLRQDGPLDDAGALAHLRATSVAMLRARYARWLGWLAAAEPDALALPPAARATPARLQRWLEALAHVQPMSRLMFVDGVLRVLSAAAPDLDWRAQRQIKAHLKRQAGRGDRTRKLGRVLSSKVLLQAGLDHAGPDAEAATTELEAMKRRRNGVMVAMLALMPMRRRAFAGLRLGHSIHLMADEILVTLPEELMKNGQPWEAPVPAQLAPLLRRYVGEVRPWLMHRGGQGHDVLWVGDRGAPFDENHFGMKIAEITKRLTGVRVPPHFFRDAAATTLVRLSPDSARLIRPILAHAGFRTAERHYIHAQGIEDGRDYAALISGLRGRR